MAIQTNYPALRPSLLLDFANTKTLDPRVTFTRASNAAYYDGVTVAKAEENLLLRSQDYSATWTATSLTPVTGKTAPDSTSTATEFTASGANGTLTQSVTAIAADYTFSVWMRRVTGTGNVDISAHSGGTWVTQTITASWARYTVTQTLTAGTRTPGIRVVTSGDAIEVWGAQLEQRSAVTAYTPTTTEPITRYQPQLLTAPAGVPRFDHNPITGESLGLLVEEQRANINTYSDDFANAAWTKTQASIESNTIIAPDGTQTADTLREDTSTGQHRVLKAAITAASSTAYTQSWYVKPNGRTRVEVFDNSSGLSTSSIFELTGNGSVVSTGAAVNSNGIELLGNGWYRIRSTSTIQPAVTVCSPALRLIQSGTTSSYTGDGYSGVFIWGAQLEAGAFASSYIPTVAATVTRQADAASMTGTNFSSWYNAAEGTLYADYISNNVLSTPFVVFISDAPTNNYLAIIDNPSNVFVRGYVYREGVVQADMYVTITKSRFRRGALAYATNNCAASASGATPVIDTAALIPSVSQMTIGAIVTGSSNINGPIRKLAYYPLRITNAQLQALTL